MLLALVGCRGAAAATDLRSEIGVPAGWIEMPAVEKAMAKTGAHGVAWGDPSMGCYLVIAQAKGAKEDAAEAADAMGKALGLSGMGTGTGTGTVKRDGVEGKTRIWAVAQGDDVVSTAAACVYNDREPAACGAACDAVWTKLSTPPVIP
jgi:hypothetical protein